MDRCKDRVTYDVANEFTVKLIFGLAETFHIPIERVFSIIEEIGYQKVLNDDELCCLLAHDGLKATISEWRERFNDILSRDSK